MPTYDKEIDDILEAIWLDFTGYGSKPEWEAKVKAQLSALLQRAEIEGRIKEHIYRKIPHEHNYTIDLGDPCFCGSDNCAMCEFCGDENHD